MNPLLRDDEDEVSRGKVAKLSCFLLVEERRKKKVVREKRKREKKEQSHSADVTSSNPLDLSESVDILETSSHETFVENPLSLIDRRSSISSLTESEFSSSCHYRHRRKSSTDTSPIAYDVSKPTADFGDLLLLEDIPSNQSLNPSLPQTIKPFNTSLCKCKSRHSVLLKIGLTILLSLLSTTFPSF